jgi:predicted DNA-binding transcriptional regulator AlpA
MSLLRNSSATFWNKNSKGDLNNKKEFPLPVKLMKKELLFIKRKV